MLDLGFEPDVREIMSYLPSSPSRQTLMFSATWPDSVQKLAAEFITSPIRVSIGNIEQEVTTNKNIKQQVEVIEDRARDQRLIQLLQQHAQGGIKKKIIIFVLYKKEVDRVERLLVSRGFECVGVSSDRSQHDRIAAIEKFKNDKISMLVATDVAARGLDIDNIHLVINYSFPLTIEDYIHRIGRTGRGGKTGEGKRSTISIHTQASTIIVTNQPFYTVLISCVLWFFVCLFVVSLYFFHS